MLFQLVGEFVARAGAAGVTFEELIDALRHFNNEPDSTDDKSQNQQRRKS